MMKPVTYKDQDDSSCRFTASGNDKVDEIEHLTSILEIVFSSNVNESEEAIYDLISCSSSCFQELDQQMLLDGLNMLFMHDKSEKRDYFHALQAFCTWVIPRVSFNIDFLSDHGIIDSLFSLSDCACALEIMLAFISTNELVSSYLISKGIIDYMRQHNQSDSYRHILRIIRVLSITNELSSSDCEQLASLMQWYLDRFDKFAVDVATSINNTIATLINSPHCSLFSFVYEAAYKQCCESAYDMNDNYMVSVLRVITCLCEQNFDFILFHSFETPISHALLDNSRKCKGMAAALFKQLVSAYPHRLFNNNFDRKLFINISAFPYSTKMNILTGITIAFANCTVAELEQEPNLILTLFEILLDNAPEPNEELFMPFLDSAFHLSELVSTASDTVTPLLVYFFSYEKIIFTWTESCRASVTDSSDMKEVSSETSFMKLTTISATCQQLSGD